MSATRVEWVMLLIALSASGLLLTVGRGSPDDTLELETSITRADATELGCWGAVGELSCAFDERGQPVQSTKPFLRPFVDGQREVVIISGLFESPAVTAWVTQAGDARARSRVRCRVRLLSRAPPFGFRFRTTDEFGQRSLPAFSALACEVLP